MKGCGTSFCIVVKQMCVLCVYSIAAGSTYRQHSPPHMQHRSDDTPMHTIAMRQYSCASRQYSCWHGHTPAGLPGPCSPAVLPGWTSSSPQGCWGLGHTCTAGGHGVECMHVLVLRVEMCDESMCKPMCMLVAASMLCLCARASHLHKAVGAQATPATGEGVAKCVHVHVWVLVCVSLCRGIAPQHDKQCCLTSG
jgi:hypothetical protein